MVEEKTQQKMKQCTVLKLSLDLSDILLYGRISVQMFQV